MILRIVFFKKIFFNEVTVVLACSYRGSFANPHFRRILTPWIFYILYIWSATEWTGLVGTSQKNNSYKSKNQNMSIGFKPTYLVEFLCRASILRSGLSARGFFSKFLSKYGTDLVLVCLQKPFFPSFWKSNEAICIPECAIARLLCCHWAILPHRQ